MPDIRTPSATAATPLWSAGEARNKLVVISDLHLGIDDAYSETVQNRPLLREFLQRLCVTADVRELIIAGDFLDAWFLPVYYPAYTDEARFYRAVIANNRCVIDALNAVAESGIRLVYVPGNHDLTLDPAILREALPSVYISSDAQGLGAYRAGDRGEIVVEHGHRYDVFSAPDALTNAELCGNADTILPAGYFYARYAATWVLEGRPRVQKALPTVSAAPDKADADQYGAYLYYSLLRAVSERMTPREAPDERIFDMRIAGFNDAYTYLDFYPATQPDGTISAPVLYKNIQRTWSERQRRNHVLRPNSFIEAVSGTLDGAYYSLQAGRQYLKNSAENTEIVVFGHTHVPVYSRSEGDRLYINAGTWIDHNTDFPEAARTFAVITTGERDAAALYSYEADGSLCDLGARLSAAEQAAV